MTHTIQFFVPSTDGEQQQSEELLAKRTADVGSTISKLTGGATVLPGTGLWVNGDGETVQELVNIVMSFSGEDVLNTLLKLARLWLIL